MTILLFGSSFNDSATMDELAHIPSGYSYVKLKDYRLNPEHPPLIKDLAGLPLLALRLNFPTNVVPWTEYINGQWDMGRIFLYESGNDPDQILFWARLPVMLLALFFGWIIFRYSRRLYGGKVAFLTLLFYTFSPTFIAHSRLVTTDLAAAFGFFLGIIAYISFLENPRWTKVFWGGMALGLALLLKFSTFLLIPLFGFLLLAWVLINPFFYRQRIENFSRLLGKTIVMGLVAFLLIWPIYQLHVWNYPPERQKADSALILTSFNGGPDPEWTSCKPLSKRPIALRGRCLGELTIWAADKPVLRAGAEWLLGFLMVSQRQAGGNTAFFWGEVSAAGWKHYFPTLYLFKEPLAFHLLTLIALGWSLSQLNKQKGQLLLRIKSWLQNNFIEFSFFSFIVVYWVASIHSPLNIGIRHVLPTFPFLYMIVSHRLVQFIEKHNQPNPTTWWQWLQNLWNYHLRMLLKWSVVALLLMWLIIDTILISPHYIAYFNEIAGGPGNGYNIAADSNLDWGQDLKRLRDFVDSKGIQKISVDYFGGGNPQYYFGEKFEPWWSARGKAHGWFAISATFRQGAFGKTAPGFVRRPEDSYEWLKNFQPVTTIGHSIFVYRLP